MKRRHIAQRAFVNLHAPITLLVCATATCSIISGTLLAFFRSEAPKSNSQRTLSFAERVAYQRAIEDVYWRHRIWPASRPDPKPSPDAVMSQAQLEKKVENYLRRSQALEDHWQCAITDEQLQAEMDRMAQHTKQPEVLREIFESLGNDPFVIAECLARSILAERFISGLTSGAEHPSFRAKSRMERLGKPQHGREGRRLSEWGMSESNPAALLIGNSTRFFNFAQVAMATNLHNAAYKLPEISTADGCIDDTWTATSTTDAPEARLDHTAVWTGTEMVIWGGAHGFDALNTGGRYDPSTDNWTATSTTNAPASRYAHTAVWTGSEMIVWGGLGSGSFLDNGSRYNPSTDSWTAISTTNAPAARWRHTAVWTGSEMIVWGGSGEGAGNYLNTGGRYDPSTDSWMATSTTKAPTGRQDHPAVWTGGEMIIWGGYNGNTTGLNTGGRYDPSTDNWTATSITDAPEARFYHTAIWSGSEMIVWGGFPYRNTGGRYSAGTDSWTATTLSNAPTARWLHTAVWTGSEMIIWGGFGASFSNIGGRYDPDTDSWTATSTSNAPEARLSHTAVWTDSEMIVWGGQVANSDQNPSRLAVAARTPPTVTNTGGRYCAQLTPPTPTPTAPPPTPTATSTPRATPVPRVRPSPRPRP